MSSGAPASIPLTDAEASARSESEQVGNLLVECGALTSDQLKKLLRIQSRLEDQKAVGQLAIELGMITRARLDQALKSYRRGLPLESILVERGIVRAEQVSAARLALHGTTKDVARHLVEVGAVAERAYAQAYCEKHDLRFIDLEPAMVDRALLKKVSIKYLARQR
ncbi:MAG: hypothetical protein ABL982_15350, partial [Vicinamibacterales bacterium]